MSEAIPIKGKPLQRVLDKMKFMHRLPMAECMDGFDGVLNEIRQPLFRAEAVSEVLNSRLLSDPDEVPSISLAESILFEIQDALALLDALEWHPLGNKCTGGAK